MENKIDFVFNYLNKDLFAKYNKDILDIKFSRNKSIFFGHYPQSNNGDSGIKESIEWKILKREDNKALLLSEKGLDCHEYHNCYDRITWENSELKEWLNSEFIINAFNDEENLILADNNIIKDKVFILNSEELNEYKSILQNFLAIATDYCSKNIGNQIGWNNRCKWWLRSYTNFYDYQECVTEYGEIRKKTALKKSAKVAVRPAIWVNIYSDVFLTDTEKKETAQRLFDEEDYINAEKCFQKLNNSEKVKLCKYFQAKKLLDEGSFVDAYNIYLTISDYQDVSKILVENKNMITLKSLIEKCSVGNTIEFGKFYKNNTNEKEPIEWVVLKQDSDNTILVIAKNAINCRLFDSKKENVLWSNSEICNYLNNDFYMEAFSDQEKECIWSSTITNNICSRFNNENSEIQNNTEEYNVFLLSIDDVNQYFPEIQKRKCKATSYGKQNGAFVEFGDYCWWWLRNQGYYTNRASYVDNYGQIIENGANVNSNDICVRPAIWIGLQNIMESLSGNIKEGNNESKNGISINKNFLPYLYSAYINKIPLIMFGEKSKQIAIEFASFIDNNPYILDFNNSIEVDDISNNIVVIDNLIESRKLVEIAELLEKRDKFYIITIPDNNVAKSLPHSFYNYALPVLSDYVIDESGSNHDSNRKVINGYLGFEPCDENELKLSNQIKDLLNDLRVSKLTQWLYTKLLTEAHLINNQLTEKEDLKFILLSYANNNEEILLKIKRLITFENTKEF